jgi:enamine deaminase RidA (YjgF/YER057c/UK114 family)
MKKQGLGLVHHGGKEMMWGVGSKTDDYVFLAGVEARSAEDDVPVEGIMAQTTLVLDRIKSRLEAAGTTMENVLTFKWYIKNRLLVPEFYIARDTWFLENCPVLRHERPYGSTLLIVELCLDEMLVEIDCVACMPD